MRRVSCALAMGICILFSACGGGGGTDGSGGSQPPPLNSPPSAIATSVQRTAVGALVQVDGSASSDVDGDQLSYRWTLVDRSYGSAAVLSSGAGSQTSFVADLPGTYTLSLSVSDGQASTTTTVSIVAAPVIRTRLNGIVSVNTTLTAAESPYSIEDRLQIAAGVTLTIEPGASIFHGDACTGDHCVIEVFGTLLAEGTQGSPIQLDWLDISKGRTGDGYISVKHARLRQIYVEPDVLHDSVVAATVIQPIRCVAVCSIERNAMLGGGIIAAEPTQIKNNAFNNDNIAFASSLYAIEARVSGLVIEKNSFLTTDSPSVLVGRSDLDVRGNYWGTQSPDGVRAAIMDRNDDLNILGIGLFEPFLLSPDGDTPSLQPYL